MKVMALNANNTVWGTWDGVREWSLRSPHLWIQYDNGDSDMVDLPASVVGLAGYWLAGFWVAEVTWYYLLSLPVAAVAILLGGRINRRLKGRSFLFLVHIGLLLIGCVLLVQSVTR